MWGYDTGDRGIDWKMVGRLNPDTVVSHRDIEGLQSFLNMFLGVQFNLNESFVLNHPLLPRLLILLQLSIKYLYDCQQKLSNELSGMYSKYDKARKINSALRSENADSKAMIVTLKSQCERCPVCGTRFKTAAYLDAHIRRRHSVIIKEWNAVRTETPIPQPKPKPHKKRTIKPQPKPIPVVTEQKQEMIVPVDIFVQQPTEVFPIVTNERPYQIPEPSPAILNARRFLASSKEPQINEEEIDQVIEKIEQRTQQELTTKPSTTQQMQKIEMVSSDTEYEEEELDQPIIELIDESSEPQKPELKTIKVLDKIKTNTSFYVDASEESESSSFEIIAPPQQIHQQQQKKRKEHSDIDSDILSALFDEEDES